MIKKLLFFGIFSLFFILGLNAQQVKTIKTDSTIHKTLKTNKPKNNVVFRLKLNQPKAFVHENSPMQKKENQTSVKQKAIKKKEQ